MYYLFFSIFYLISLLPFFILYGLSNIVAFVLYHLVKYRRDVVMKNLEIAFPEKSEAERIAIAKKFYRNFCDTWVEAIKLLSMSRRTLEKRMFAETDVFEKIKNSGKSAQLYMGHIFNWEWANLRTSMITQIPFLGVYQPISSKAVDRLFYHIRGKTGTVLLPANDMRTAMLPWRDKQYALALVADQNPGKLDNAYWVNYFTKKAPFVKGPEKYARFNNTTVVFCRIEQKKRGYYHIHFETITENPRDYKDGELTLKFVRHTEECLRLQPHLYLWSHRRWRHEWNESYAANTLE